MEFFLKQVPDRVNDSSFIFYGVAHERLFLYDKFHLLFHDKNNVDILEQFLLG